MSQQAGSRRTRLAFVVSLLLVVLCPPLFQPVAAQPSRPLVYSAVVDALIHPVSAEFMIEAMDRADREGAALVVFTLRTPGGLLDSTRRHRAAHSRVEEPGGGLRRAVRQPRRLGGLPR